MDIGLYQLKYPFRKLISFLLPLCKNINPNWISILLLPVGAGTAICYYFAIQGALAYFFLLGALLSFIRMIIGTMDGLAAIEFKRESVLGDVVNRLTPELCDLMLLPTIVLAKPEYFIVGVFAIVMAWATIFLGLIGAASYCPVQSVLPVGQTDRLVALAIFSILQFCSLSFHWGYDFISIFLYWILVGGSLTLFLRLKRTIFAAQELDRKNRLKP